MVYPRTFAPSATMHWMNLVTLISTKYETHFINIEVYRNSTILSLPMQYSGHFGDH